MKEQHDITRGGLAGKMKDFSPAPPDSVWKGIEASLVTGNPRRRLFFLLSTAAAILLAVSVGVPLLLNNGSMQEITTTSQQDVAEKLPTANLQPEESTGETQELVRPAETTARTSRLERKVRETLGVMENPLIAETLPEETPVTTESIDGQYTGETSRPDETVRSDETSLADGSNLVDENSLADGSNLVDENSLADGSNRTDEIVPVETEINEDSLLDLLKTDPIELEPDIVNPSAGKWQIGASISPQVSYRDVASSDITQNMKVNSSESAKLTYSGGLRLNYAPSRRVSVESGIYYNRIGVNIGDYRNFTYARVQEMDYAPVASGNNVVSISNSMGSVVAEDKSLFLSDYSTSEAIADYHMLRPNELFVNEATVDGFTQSFEFLEIPFNVKYLLIDRALQVQLIGGISTNFLVSNTFRAATPSGLEEIGRVDNVNWVNYSGNAGIGFAYEILQNFSFNLEPRFRYYLNSINTSELPVTRPYTFGIRTGVSYSF